MAPPPTAETAVRPSSAKTLAHQAFELLYADILAARLKPGEKMQVEKLSEAYGVGVTPLREALSKLSSLDLVTAEGQRGFRVAPVSIANLLDVTRARCWIEAVTLRAAIAAGDRGWEAAIVGAAHRLKLCPKGARDTITDEWNRENRAFHDALVAACGSPVLLAFRDRLYDLSDRYRRYSGRIGLGGRNLDAEHKTIMEAVLARDAEAAIAASHEHFITTTRSVLVHELKSKPEADRLVRELRASIAAGMGAG